MVYDIASMLANWQQIGVYDFVLPFLLIFAVVYGILTASHVMSGNKGVNTLIAFSIALLSLRFEFVPLFFSQVFPRFGVGIAVFLVFLIFAGFFIPEEYMKGWSIGFSILGVLIAIVVVYNSFDWLGWTGFGGSFWDQWGGLIVLGIILVGLILVIVAPWEGKSTEVKEGSFGKKWH